MAGPVEFQVFTSRAAAATAAAELLAGQLACTLDEQPRVALIVSGGSTPGPCFAQLCKQPLDWSRVCVVPSDERWVPASDPASNEGLIRRQLLRDQAGPAQLLPLFREGVAPEQAPGLIEQELAALPRPFSAALLGMGEDGHFASLFPDFAELSAALDPAGNTRCVLVQTAGSPHLRISLTLPALLASREIVLLMFGEAKRRVFEAASQGGDYPVASLLRHASCPLRVVWAP